MNQEQLRKIVKETFESDFDRERFAEFVGELLKNVDFSKAFQLGGNRVRQAFQDKVLSYERVGTYTDINGEKVDILIVNLRRKELLERARKGLRNFVADYLQSERGINKSAVLAAYAVKDEEGNYLAQTGWRFSYVTLEKDLRQNEKGKFKEEIVHITPARRYSFRVGDGEETNTAQNRFFALLKSQSSPMLAQIEEAFSVDKLNKDFYDSYEQLLKTVGDALIEVRRNNKPLDVHWREKFFEDEDFTNDPHDPDKKTKDFAKKLLGQIIFLYFLQRKGWLGVHFKANYGDGDRNFLKNIFDDRTNDYKNYLGFINRTDSFFNDVLKHIFYDALARENPKDRYGNSDLRFPFLNGGLFEAKFDWKEYDIVLPDDVFSNAEKKDEGTGIFDVFDRFNFTANESEPSEIEVAIDPEMLGRVFENQLLKEERGSKGTFYTPRVIVNYMCRESLLNYLFTHFDDRTLKNRPDSLQNRISRADLIVYGDAEKKGFIPVEPTYEELKKFVSFADSSFDYQQNGAQKDEGKMFPSSIVENAAEIDWLLQDVKICDPAIGSGAFPVGLLQEIVRLREAIAPLLGEHQSDDDEGFSLVYQMKLHAIQNSIYGVDIETSAVDIARLRLWLSLIVDEQQREKVRALPNLDYKIMQGNSLLEEFGGVRLVQEDIFNRRPQTIEIEASEEEILLKQLQNESQSIRQAEGNKSVMALKLTSDIKKLKTVIEKRKKDTTPKLTDNLIEKSRNEEYFAEIERIHKKFFDENRESKKKDLRVDLEIAILRYVNNHLNERETLFEGLIEKYSAEIASLERTIQERLKTNTETKRLKDLRSNLRDAETELDKLNETRVELKKLWLIDNEQNADKDLANISRKNTTEAQTKPFFLWEIQFLEVFRDNRGFDIVIANPPYVRSEKITRYKDALRRAFPEVFAGTADILVYFYTRGWNILRDKGTLAFITSNKYFRANYGEGLRRFLGTNTRILQIIDFGDAPVFEAAAYASIIVLQKERAKANQTQVWTFPQNEPISDFEEGFHQLGFDLPQKELKGEGWLLETLEVLRLLEKIKSRGTSLSEYINGEFYRGIVTGLNDAFVIDEKTRNDLIAKDKSSSDILKPFLRGRDVKRWKVNDPNLWLIFTRRGINIEKYPAIKNHLLQFKDELTPGIGRKAGSYKWFEIQDNIAYWQEFEDTKIIYPNICNKNEFAWDEESYFTNQKAFIIPNSTKFLLGYLNSKLVFWLFDKLLPKLLHGYFEPSGIFMNDLPIPDGEDWQKEIIEKLVEYILFLKKNAIRPIDTMFSDKKNYILIKDANIYVSYFEAIIDGLVYELFLPDELSEADKEFFIHLKTANLPALDGDESPETIRTVYKTLHAENHPVRQNLFLLDSIESIRIILGKEK